MENRTRFRVENGDLVFYIGTDKGCLKVFIGDIRLKRIGFYQSLAVIVYFHDFEMTFTSATNGKVQIHSWTNDNSLFRWESFKSRSWDGFLMSAMNAKIKYLEEKLNAKAV